LGDSSNYALSLDLTMAGYSVLFSEQRKGGKCLNRGHDLATGALKTEEA